MLEFSFSCPSSEVIMFPTRPSGVSGKKLGTWVSASGATPTTRTRSRVITEPGQRHCQSIGRTRTEATAVRLRLKGGERLYPERIQLLVQHRVLFGFQQYTFNRFFLLTTALGGFAREVAAWLGYIDPTHEAGKLIQRITKGTLRATEAWTDGRTC